MRAVFFVAMAAVLIAPAVAKGTAKFDGVSPYQATTINDIVAQNQQHLTICGQLYQAKRIKTSTALMHCSYDGYVSTLRTVGAGSTDLIDELVTGEFAIAERIDRRRITRVEGQAEESALESRVQGEASVRLSAAQEAQAQTQAAQQQAVQVQANAQAQAEARRRLLLLCEAAGGSMPTQSGSFSESLGNAARAKANCMLGLPAPAPPPPSQSSNTTCTPNALGGIDCRTW